MIDPHVALSNDAQVASMLLELTDENFINQKSMDELGQALDEWGRKPEQTDSQAHAKRISAHLRGNTETPIKGRVSRSNDAQVASMLLELLDQGLIKEESIKELSHAIHKWGESAVSREHAKNISEILLEKRPELE